MSLYDLLQELKNDPNSKGKYDELLMLSELAFQKHISKKQMKYANYMNNDICKGEIDESL
jgi:hypothetical protein